MFSFALTPDLLTGIPEIDEQHTELLDLANAVITMPAEGLSPPLLTVAMKFLMGYVAYHFAAEEKVMMDLGYPDFDVHFNQHRLLQQRVADLAAAVRAQEAKETKAREFARLLGQWIISHIRETDRDMAKFLRERLPNPLGLHLPGVQALRSSGAIAPDFDDEIAKGSMSMRLSLGLGQG